METFVTLGLVLKETRYKESDRILTILTPGLGVISASAQSSLRLKSKLFSACGLFCYSEFTLVPGRNMYTVREAAVKNVFHGISSSIEGMSLAMYLAEMAAALTPTGQEAERELRLLLNCLYMISEHKASVAFCRSWCAAATAAPTMQAIPFIWMCRRAICSVLIVRPRLGNAAIWIAMHCLHCGTSALWRTKKYFRSRFLWAVWKSWQP